MKLSKKDFLLSFILGICLILLIHLLGMVFNYKVMEYNDFRMPVFTEETFSKNQTIILSYDGVHSYYNNMSAVNFPFLSDIIKVGGYKYSIGDFMQYLTFPLLMMWAILNLFVLLIKYYEDENKDKKERKYER